MAALLHDACVNACTQRYTHMCRGHVIESYNNRCDVYILLANLYAAGLTLSDLASKGRLIVVAITS